MATRLRDEDVNDVTLVICAEGTPDQRRYNRPTGDEVGLLIVDGSYKGQSGDRDIVVQTRSNQMQWISVNHRFYDAMHYVLMFPQGDEGWNIGAQCIDGSRVTCMDWYKYRLMIRSNNDNIEGQNDLHRFGKLFQQYITDMYAKVESERLNYIRSNQDKLRSDLYKSVADAVNLGDNDMANVGKRVILPLSFIGGPCHMQQLYQDAMSIVRRFGKPDIFVTVTTNPRWHEIQDCLLPGQTAAERPDICVRVFKMKLKELMHDLTKNMVLGKVVGHVHTVEFQKRGLPHAHILLILAQTDKPRTPEDVDDIVSAELPNAAQYPAARATVERLMMHRPCGDLNSRSPCMQGGACSKRFPKQFSDETSMGENGYPVYRRRRNNNNHVYKNGVRMDNRWVVPHNIFLCTKYDAHINVEICTSIASIKYVYKYVYKGHDRAAVVVSQNQRQSNAQSTTNEQADPSMNEIKTYLDARYVSACEGCWRLFSFSLHKEFPNHQRLAIHLEDEQLAYFNEDDDPMAIADRAHETTLTAWFNYNIENEDARQVLYPDFPENYVFVKSDRHWKIRERGHGATIGRMYAVSPSQVEKYHLRLLLYHVPGVTSFNELKTVENELMPSFQAAARRRGLLTGQQEWEDCLEQASSYQLPAALRQLFSVILTYCSPEDPHALWMAYRSNLSEDFLHAARNEANDQSLPESDHIYGQALLAIESIMATTSRSLTEFDGFTLPDRSQQNNNDQQPPAPFLIRKQRDIAERLNRHPAPVLNFNNDQQNVFDTVCNALERPNTEPKVYFADGPGGTGKTYIFNALLDRVRHQGNIALAIATSGTAALLMEGGRTAHSLFKIPLDLDHTSFCSFTPRSATAQLLKLTTLIIWDEASMMSKDLIECVNCNMQDLMKSVDPELEHVPFGGKLIVFSGDFRQVLPVIPNASRAQIVAQSLKRSSENREQIAPGTEDRIKLRNSMLMPGYNLLTLIDTLYGDMISTTPSREFLMSRAILTPKNVDVATINEAILESKFPGTTEEYLSADSMVDPEESLSYPTEILNSLSPSGLPPHTLKLKPGCPVMLLRNLNTSQGLCNGTRLICISFRRNVIEAQIATSTHIGEIVLLPRITITSKKSECSIEFQRTQFPIRLAFSMTINIAQGQTFDTIGLYLPNPVFTHGLLYVTFSRVRTPNSIFITLDRDESTINGQEASIGHFTEKIGHFSERQLVTFLNANWSLFCKPIGHFSENQLVTFLKIN
ncbi:hypothetical protein INT45_004502 [Circinella minor]|uniref:ATP-dependent DNA helicase n=1 Tax=Circinella minor TaxID=1195481 RepID=A0A8H7RIA9_9FUNG|nr:hypothetical protein INT45_004502 [Circinella minor]